MLALALLALAHAAPVQLAHQGRLLDAGGAPIQGTANLTVRLLGPADAVVHSEPFNDVSVQDGFYAVVLGSGVTLDSAAFATPPLTLEVWVGGALLARQPFLSVGHAAAADRARTIEVAGAAAGPTCATQGQIVWDTSLGSLRVCVDGAWVMTGERRIVIDGGVRRWSDGTAAPSCDEYRHPTGNASYTGEVGSGTYLIDPDGVGGAAAFPVTCDMEHDGGGWTRVVYQNYDEATSGWSNNARTSCGQWGNLHGGYATFGGPAVTTTLGLQGVAHTELRFQTTFIKIDSWDGETATLHLDGTQRWSASFTVAQDSNQCGNPSNPTWAEAARAIDVTIGHTANSLAVSFDENLSDPGTDESWGHDDLTVWVR